MATNARPVGAFTRKVAAEIRSRRKRMLLKQDYVSSTAAIPLSTLSQLENGRSAIDMEQLERLAEVLQISPDGLIREAIRNAPADADMGPLVTSTGSVAAASTADQHASIEAYAEEFQRQARESSTPNPTGPGSTEDHRRRHA